MDNELKVITAFLMIIFLIFCIAESCRDYKEMERHFKEFDKDLKHKEEREKEKEKKKERDKFSDYR